MILTFTPDKFDGWLADNWPDLITRDNPLGLANAGNGTELDTANWPSGHGEPPTVEAVEAWTPSLASIITPVFTTARRNAPLALDGLKGKVWGALVAGGMSEAEATAAGVGLVLRHDAILSAFTSAGGHPLAASALYAAIASEESVAALPWLTAPILAIFAAALTPS